MKTEVRLSGSGGQGMILAGIILAEAAGIYDGKQVVQTQSYGVEARGGASRAEVIISDEEIVFPEITRPDILLAMNQASADKYVDSLKEDGVLIVDSTQVKKTAPAKSRVHEVPITELARKAGNTIVANMVALGVLIGLTGVASESSLRRAVFARVPKGTEELNGKALDLGLEGARALLGK
ncbi:MAG TPA: 2-oxoacid:acceptor oxidoreductase family protein [Thermodesulfobacteriota bacterium]|nr:2-oxoacid:acceptor oxidoreductase family protein [Thermodesulfobacteriota bacterium]